MLSLCLSKTFFIYFFSHGLSFDWGSSWWSVRTSWEMRNLPSQEHLPRSFEVLPRFLLQYSKFLKKLHIKLFCYVTDVPFLNIHPSISMVCHDIYIETIVLNCTAKYTHYFILITTWRVMEINASFLYKI